MDIYKILIKYIINFFLKVSKIHQDHEDKIQGWGKGLSFEKLLIWKS